MKRILIIVISIVTLCGVGYFLYQNIDKENGTIRPIYFVPSNAAYIIEVDQPIEAWKSIKGNPLWLHLIKNKTFQTLSSGLTSLDEIVSENQFAFDLLGDRKILVSAHKYKHDDYDFLYIIDIENKLKTDFVEDVLKRVIDKEYYKLTSREYKGNAILELYDKEYKETVYISVYENILIASYVNSLVEKSLDEYNEPKIGRDINFVEVSNAVENSDLFKVYFNYNNIAEFSSLFLEEENSLIKEISNSLYFSGFSFEMDESGTSKITGVTLLNDTVNSFINCLYQSGEGKTELHNVLPDITAFFIKIGFESGFDFVSNFESALQKTDSVGFYDYKINNKKIEKFLNINLKENFYSWIGDEAAFVQLQSGGLGAKNEFAFLIKAEDIKNAKENLDFIKSKIKKKTPGKFKSVNYKGYEINYLSIKGFFKALMGKFFSKLEKPYYTIIDDFVIFSNHPQTLRIIIDRYSDGKILINDSEYKSFSDQFSANNSVFCYLHSSKLFANLLELSEQETKQSLIKNKNFITCFNQFGFELEKDGDFFNTSSIASFKNPEEIIIEENLNFKILNTLNFEKTERVASKESDLFSTIKIKLSDFDIKKYEDFYSNDILKVEVDIENGVQNGIYKQYYEDGTLMLKGHFKDDLKEGIWRFYSSDGKVLEKRNYCKGEIKE